MRKPDPPFPSFVSMSRELQQDSLRLPNYRESVILRFHPYPQTQRKTVDPLMTRNQKTVDYRYTTEPPGLSVQDEGFTTQDDDGPGTDKAVLGLDHAVNEEEGTRVRRRRSLTSLIIDLALAVRMKKRPSASKVVHNA